MHILLFEGEPSHSGTLKSVLERLDAGIDITLIRDADQIVSHHRHFPPYDLAVLGLPRNAEAAVDIVRKLNTVITGKLLLVCDTTDYERIRRFYRAGADGVIPRVTSRNVTSAAIKLVLAGGMYLPPEVFAPRHRHHSSDVSVTDGISNRLTPQQRKVLGFVAQGLSNKQIAHELSIAEGTVKLHVNAILKSLKVPNRTTAALIAREVLEPA